MVYFVNINVETKTGVEKLRKFIRKNIKTMEIVDVRKGRY